jgi:hypothetical protein
MDAKMVACIPVETPKSEAVFLTEHSAYPKSRQYSIITPASLYDKAMVSTTWFASPSTPETNWWVVSIVANNDMASSETVLSILLASSVVRPMRYRRRHDKPKSRTWSGSARLLQPVDVQSPVDTISVVEDR